ncbi:DUF5753 domain-containing protein [Actinokineospora sp. G85]|uniref:DUF5753 domain-containing protein n=1 Tax=Actinokineospora sp. G85 TaxID=3406626 RepID=UPI003C78408B
MLAVYGVVGDQRRWLLALARKAEEERWWASADHRDHLEALRIIADSASEVFDYAPAVIPPMLRTPSYALAFPCAPGVSPARQRAFDAESRKALTSLRGARYSFVVDEAALRRPMGNTEVMADQVEWLIGMVRVNGLDLRVLPFGRFGCPATAFRLYRFAKGAPLVHFGDHLTSVLLDDPVDTDIYESAMTALLAHALAPFESVPILEDALARLSGA